MVRNIFIIHSIHLLMLSKLIFWRKIFLNLSNLEPRASKWNYLHCKQFPCKFCKFPLCPKSHCIFNAIFAVIHCKQWITALNLGAFFEQQFLLNVVCIFCHLELAFSAILTRMVYNLKVLNFAVWWLQFLPILNMHHLHFESSNFCKLILAIFINT